MRIVIFISLLISAALIGGLYGALYDQFTFTLSPEFYTKMRFPQFGVSGDVNERWEVAKIGFQNTWSVGFGLGLFLTLVGLLHNSNKKMVVVSLQSFGIALFTAFIFGVCAYFLSEPELNEFVEIDIVDKTSFGKVTAMTNYSYVGGTIGMFLGVAWHVLQTRIKK